jgi:hypothetical protein
MLTVISYNFVLVSFYINGGKVFHYVRELHSSMSPFEVVQAIQSACVVVVGLDLRRTVVVLRSVDDQHVGETVVIRFRCVSQRIEKFDESHEIVSLCYAQSYFPLNTLNPTGNV